MLSKFEAKSNFHLICTTKFRSFRKYPLERIDGYLFYVDLSPIRAHPLLVPMCFIKSRHRSVTTIPNPLRDLGMVVQELNEWPSGPEHRRKRQCLQANSL